MEQDRSGIVAQIRDAPWDTLHPQLIDFADVTLRKGLGWGAEADKNGLPCIEGRDAGWFLTEAICKTLDGTRAWDPSSVDLRRHLNETMRSLIDSHLNSRLVRSRKDSSEIETFADPHSHAADIAANAEISAEFEKHILAFKATLTSDSELAELFEAYNAGYVNPRDIAALTALPEERISELKRKFRNKYLKFTKAYTGPLKQSDLVRGRK